MHVVIAAQGWPSDDGAQMAADEIAARIESAWLAAAPAEQVTVVELPIGDPTSGAALGGERETIGGVAFHRVAGSVVLSPAVGVRWEPPLLGRALAALAEVGERSTVVVPLGDIPPAGDALSLWAEGRDTMRSTLARLDILALVGSDRPLLGFHGMSAATREGRENDAALGVAAQAQEERWASVAREVDPVASRASLLATVRLSDSPGSGAAGGLAYCLAAVGARLRPAADTLAELSGLNEAASDADLLVAVIPTLDTAALDRGPLRGASVAAARRGVPCVAVSAHVGVGRRDLMAGGVVGSHEGLPGMAGLEDQIRRVAQTWTPRR